MDIRRIRHNIEETSSLLAFYDRKNNTFTYHEDLLRYLGHDLAGKLLWEHLADSGALPLSDTREIEAICRTMDESNGFFSKYFQPAGMPLHTFIFICRGDTVTIALKDLTRDIAYTESGLYDQLTGLLSRSAYCTRIDQIIAEQPGRSYAVYFFDVTKFKALNYRFGFSGGDKLLLHIASKLKTYSPHILTACRISADRFSFFADVTDISPDDLINGLLEQIKGHHLPYEINCNVGIYLVPDPHRSGSQMLDKAMIAQAAVKGSYTQKSNYYSDVLRDEMLSEQEIVGSMNTALETGRLVPFYQPQCDHRDGRIVGAEALVRWDHPEKGLISPKVFIPIFEKSGFITRLDLYMFEQVCRMLHRAREQGSPLVPISVNFSIDDLYSDRFIENLEDIRKKYRIDSSYLRIELTERFLDYNSAAVNDIFRDLRRHGYLIELDDFGSGYSSLNVLKDLDVDFIKLDMLFLADRGRVKQSRIILSSVINMARQLNMAVIAEGVETAEQADFLMSIGCSSLQGYLYARPMSQAEFEQLLTKL